MKKKWNFILVLAATGILVLACSKNKDDETPPEETRVPEITNFTPLSQEVGLTVTINGKNFATTTSGNVVQFNGVNASLNSATANQLVAVVPSGDITGKITVTVDGEKATSGQTFTVLTGPSIVLDQTELNLQTLDTATLSIANSSEFEGQTVAWNSDNKASVLVDEEGNLKAVGGGMATITATIGELTATAEITVNAAAFIAGMDNYMAKIWRNNKEYLSLEMGDGDEGEVYELVLADTGDLYAAGYIYDNDQEKSTAAVWKNGELDFSLTAGGDYLESDAHGIYVTKAGDVFVVGSAFDSNLNERLGVLWRNGNVLHTLHEVEGAGGYLRAITVDEDSGTVYATGDENLTAYVLVDGVVEQWSKEGIYSNANDIEVQGGNVYVVGSEGGKGTLWENGNPFELPSENGSYATSIFITESGDQYIGGVQYSQNSSYGSIWENGNEVMLSDTNGVVLESIYVYEGDGEIYYAGWHEIDKVAKFWSRQDSSAIDLAGGEGMNATAYSIVVK